MRNPKYTQEQIEFVKKHSYTDSGVDIVEKFKKQFGIEIRINQVNYIKRVAGLKENYLNKPYSHRWTENENQFIRDNAFGITAEELAKKFNHHFNTNLTVSQVKCARKRLKVKSGIDCRFKKGGASYPRGVGYQHQFTKEQLKFIQDNVNNSNLELARLFNQKFGTSLTPRQMYGAKNRHGITGALRGTRAAQFYSGFMLGHKNKDEFPVGTVKKWGDYPMCKKDDKTWDKESRVVWEKAHGAIPDGCMIRHLDGNLENNKLENLVCISMAENGVINSQVNFGSDTELNKTNITVAKLVVATGKKRKVGGIK